MMNSARHRAPTWSLAALTLAAFGFTSCAASSPMELVEVDVAPRTVKATVYRHEDFDSMYFDTVRTNRTEAARLLEVQCRVTNDAREEVRGTYLVEFLDGSDIQVDSSGPTEFSALPGGTFLVQARAKTAAATSAIISIRP